MEYHEGLKWLTDENTCGAAMAQISMTSTVEKYPDQRECLWYKIMSATVGYPFIRLVRCYSADSYQCDIRKIS